MKTLFLGSGPFGLPTVDRLVELGVDFEVATVPDAPQGRKKTPVPTVIKARAREHGVPCHEVATLKKPHGIELLEETGAGLVLTADIRLILTKSFLERPPRGCFNLHGSILPRWRGAAPVARGLLAGDDRFGVTLYRMVRELDAGPMVDAREYEPGARATAPEIEERIADLAADLAAEWIGRLQAGDVPLREQDESGVTLAPKLEKHEGWVDWRRTGAEIDQQTRALTPWPRTFSEWVGADGGEPVRVFLDDVLPIEGKHAAARPGEVTSLEEDQIVCACGPDGSDRVQLRVLQRAGKRALPAAEFLRGVRLAVGDRFEGGA